MLEINVKNLDALEEMLDIQTEILNKYVKDPDEQQVYRKRLYKIVGRLVIEEYEAANHRDSRVIQPLQSGL